MMAYPAPRASGRAAVAELSSAIDALEVRRRGGATFAERLELSRLLFLRGDVLGRLVDHDGAELVAREAVAASPASAAALHVRAELALRFHRFAEAAALVEQARDAGQPAREVDALRAAILQATGRYGEALVLRGRLSQDDAGPRTLGALASLLSDMGAAEAAASCFAAALRADDGGSPFSYAGLLFQWGVGAQRHNDLERAAAIFAAVEAVLPDHVPARGHRAEVALARGDLELAAALVTPLIDRSDDPAYLATHAEILAARGQGETAARVAARAAMAYERLLARRPEAHVERAAAFFIGIGDRPERALELASAVFRTGDTPRSRQLLAAAVRRARAAA